MDLIIIPFEFVVAGTGVTVSALQPRLPIRPPPTQSAPLFEEIKLLPSTPAQTLAQDVISKTNEIVESNRQNGGGNSVSIFSPVPTFPPTSILNFEGNAIPVFVPTTENQDPVYDYNPDTENNYEDSGDYVDYNEVDDGFRVNPDVAPIVPENDLQSLAGTFHHPQHAHPPQYSHYESYHSPEYNPPEYHTPEYHPPEPEVIEDLPPETSLDDPNLACYERTCDQSITGKQT